MKGQTAIETVISFGVVMVFIFLLYGFLIYPRMNESDVLRTYNLARAACLDISSAIDTVASNGNGFSQSLYLPAALLGKSYNITVFQSLVSVEWDRGQTSCRFAARNVSHASNYPPFLLDAANHIVNNSNGVVRIA